jgi:hypothetical protein
MYTPNLLRNVLLHTTAQPDKSSRTGTLFDLTAILICRPIRAFEAAKASQIEDFVGLFSALDY